MRPRTLLIKVRLALEGVLLTDLKQVEAIPLILDFKFFKTLHENSLKSVLSDHKWRETRISTEREQVVNILVVNLEERASQGYFDANLTNALENLIYASRHDTTARVLSDFFKLLESSEVVLWRVFA